MTTRSPFLTPRAFSALAMRQVRASSSRVADARDLAVVGLEDDRDLVAEAALDLAVQAVVRDVQRAVLEPLEERRFAVVEHLGERRLPAQELARQARPVSLRSRPRPRPPACRRRPCRRCRRSSRPRRAVRRSGARWTTGLNSSLSPGAVVGAAWTDAGPNHRQVLLRWPYSTPQPGRRLSVTRGPYNRGHSRTASPPGDRMAFPVRPARAEQGPPKASPTAEPDLHEPLAAASAVPRADRRAGCLRLPLPRRADPPGARRVRQHGCARRAGQGHGLQLLARRGARS